MAIVKGPALSMEASGNLGSICYSRWRSSAVARAAWTGTVPNTPKQQAAQSILTAVAKAWGQELTPEERESWIGLAGSEYHIDRLGTQYHPTGYQLFMQRNIQRKRYGYSLLNKPLGGNQAMYAKTWEITWQASASRMYVRLYNFLSTGRPNNLEYWRAGGFKSGGRNPIEPEWRLKGIVSVGGWIYDTDIILGNWYWYRARMFRKSGVVSNFIVGQKQAA